MPAEAAVTGTLIVQTVAGPINIDIENARVPSAAVKLSVPQLSTAAPLMVNPAGMAKSKVKSVADSTVSRYAFCKVKTRLAVVLAND